MSTSPARSTIVALVIAVAVAAAVGVAVLGTGRSSDSTDAQPAKRTQVSPPSPTSSGAATTPTSESASEPETSSASASASSSGPASTEANPSGRSGPAAVDANGRSRPRNCASRPRRCGYPDSTNTGARVSSGKMRIVPDQVRRGRGWHYDRRGFVVVDRDGAHLSRLLFRTSVTIKADRVTISDCRFVIRGDGWAVGLASGSGTRILHNDITSPTADGPDRLQVGVKDVYGRVTDPVIRANDISHTSTGVQLGGGTVSDNYIHAMGFDEGDHVNGFSSNGGTRRLVLRHNTILNDRDQTDAIALFQDFAPQTNRLITDNLVGGGGYTIYAGANPGKAAGARNIVVTGNRFTRMFHRRSGYYGPATAFVPSGGNVWSGNFWDDTMGTVRSP